MTDSTDRLCSRPLERPSPQHRSNRSRRVSPSRSSQRRRMIATPRSPRYSSCLTQRLRPRPNCLMESAVGRPPRVLFRELTTRAAPWRAARATLVDNSANIASSQTAPPRGPPNRSPRVDLQSRAFAQRGVTGQHAPLEARWSSGEPASIVRVQRCDAPGPMLIVFDGRDPLGSEVPSTARQSIRLH
jgi:hypothetical protein